MADSKTCAVVGNYSPSPKTVTGNGRGKTMQFLSQAGFWLALLSIVSAGILLVHARSDSRTPLQAQMADRVKQSIEVLDTCAQPLGGALVSESKPGSFSSGHIALVTAR
jgi:hypothetical protein